MTRNMLSLRPLSLLGLARTVVIVWLSASFVLSLATLADRGAVEGAVCLLASLCTAVAALPLLEGLGGRRDERELSSLRVLEPVWLALLTVSVGVTAQAFFLVYGPDERVQFLLLGRPLQDLVMPLVVLLVGIGSLSLGYRAGAFRVAVPGLDRLSSGRWNVRRAWVSVAFMLLVGLVSVAAFVAVADIQWNDLADLSSKRFSYLPGTHVRVSHGYLRWGANLLELAFYVVLTLWLSERRALTAGRAAALAGLALLAISFPLFVSSRFGVALVFIRTVILWVCLRGAPRVRTILLSSAAVLVALTAMLGLRGNEWDAAKFRRQLSPTAVLEMTAGGRHFLDLSKTAHIYHSVPDVIEHEYGRTLVTWLVAPIPRRYWNDKPTIGVGTDIGWRVFGAPRTSGVTPGIVAELYWNLSWPGVALGMFLLGLFLRSFWETSRHRFPALGAVLLYTFVMPRMTLGMIPSSVSSSITRLLVETIPLAIFLLAVGGAGENGRSDSDLA